MKHYCNGCEFIGKGEKKEGREKKESVRNKSYGLPGMWRNVASPKLQNMLGRD